MPSQDILHMRADTHLRCAFKQGRTHKPMPQIILSKQSHLQAKKPRRKDTKQ
jgi:hypothetical protein